MTSTETSQLIKEFSDSQNVRNETIWKYAGQLEGMIALLISDDTEYFKDVIIHNLKKAIKDENSLQK